MPILQAYLYSDVAKNGTVSANYPVGFTPDSFDKTGAKVCYLSAESALPADSYSLSWGASAVTVTSLKDTWKGGVSLFVSVPDVVNGQGEEVRAIINPVTGGIKIIFGDKQVVALGLRASPLRCATFGDSTANVGTTNTDCSIFDVPFPASSLTVASYELSKWAVYQKYPQAKLVANGGVSGDTTTLMLARDTAGASATRKSIGDVLNLSPDVVFLRAGSVNNLTPITAGNYAATVATCYAEHIKIINRFSSAGVAVIDEGIAGYSGAVATYPDLVRSAVVTLNSMFAAYIKSLGKSNVVFLDCGTCEASGGLLAAASNDGIHLNIYGSMMVASAEAAALTLLFGESSGPRFPGSNLIANPLFAATGALGYGVGPSLYSATGSNATLANAKFEDIDGKLYWTVEVTPTTTTNNVVVNVPFDATTFGIVANDVFGFEMDVMAASIDGLGAPPNIIGLYVRNDIYKTAAGRMVPTEQCTVMGGFPAIYKAHSSFSYRCQESSAALTNASTTAFHFGTGTLTPFKVGIAAPRLVKLGVAPVTN